jgi:hypothetical protein
MKTPAGSVSTSHGSIDAKLTALSMRGSSVRDRAKSGAAAATMPSPRFDAVDALKRRQKAPPSGDFPERGEAFTTAIRR